MRATAHRLRRTMARWLPVVLAALSAAPLLAQSADYRIGQGDILTISVWAQPELSGQFKVDGSGALALPLIGSVPAAGRSVADILTDVRTRLADGYVNNPQVAVSVAEFKSQRVYVVGEVRTPGVVPLSGALTLIEALTRVGSFTDYAGGELLVVRPPADRPATAGPILPNEPGAQEVLRVDVQTLQSRGPSQNIELRDGDTVVVPRAEVVYIIGQINGPGSYTYEKDMTLLQLISRANGVTDMGTTKRLKIVRIVDGKRSEVKASVGDKLRPGDTVVVASRWF